MNIIFCPSAVVEEVLTFRSVGFSLSQATNIVLVYVVDAYRPIAGEVIVSMLAFKGRSPMKEYLGV